MCELVNVAETVGRVMGTEVHREALQAVARFVVHDATTGDEYRLRPCGGYMTDGVEYVPIAWSLVAFSDDGGDDDETWATLTVRG